MKNKALSVADSVISHNTDIPALTETRLGTCSDAKVLSQLLLPGYDILQMAWPDTNSGSMAVLFKEQLGV